MSIVLSCYRYSKLQNLFGSHKLFNKKDLFFILFYFYSVLYENYVYLCITPINNRPMKTLNDVKKLANDMLDKKFTIQTYFNEYTLSAREMGYRFEFDNCKKSFGRCFYTQKKITLSLPLCEVNLDKIETKITNTILHELAHAFSVEIFGRDGRGHGAKWKNVAKQIGCDGERCFDGSSINRPSSKYTLVCDNCKKETPKYKKISRSYACGDCCRLYAFGKFSVDYQLRLVVNY
jgi:predicted SprT family Zn-dependent metalloprotease